MNGLGSLGSAALNGLKALFSSAWSAIRSAASSAWSAIRSTFTTGVTNAVAAVKEHPAGRKQPWATSAVCWSAPGSN